MGGECCPGHSEDGLEFFNQLGRLKKECDFVLDRLQVQIAKAANPFRRSEFVRFEASLISELRQKFKSEAGDEIAKIKKLIRRVDLERPETIEKFVKESGDLLRGLERSVSKKVVPVLESSIRDMYQMAKVVKVNELFRDSERDRAKRFSNRDERVVDLIHKHQVFYATEGVRNQVKNFDERMRSILEDGLKKGTPSIVVGEKLGKAFGSTVDDESYWNVVASAWLNRTRNWAALEVMDYAGIEKYVVIEAMDTRTCPICESMNGKEFSVKKQVNKLEKISASEDPNDLRYSTPWMTTRRTDEGEFELGYRRSPGGRFISVAVGEDFSKTDSTLQRLGLAMPPFHGLCRGTVGAA